MTSRRIDKQSASKYAGNLTHGLSEHYIYSIWRAMKVRCYNPKDGHYRYYGDKGIKVCERWLNSVESFFEDMGERPTPQHSLDRIDNDGDYYPGNCRWATRKEQMRNRSDSAFLTIEGETLTIAGWAERFGISHSLIWNRIKRGWPIDITIGQPARYKRRALP